MTEQTHEATDAAISEDEKEFGSEIIRSKSYSHMELTLHTEYSKRIYKRIYKYMRHNIALSMSIVRKARIPGANEAAKKVVLDEFDRVAAPIRADMELAKHQVKEFALQKQLEGIEHVHTEVFPAKYDTPYARNLLNLIKELDDLTVYLNLLYMEGIIEESHSADRCFEFQQKLWKFSTFLQKHADRAEEASKQELLKRARKKAEKKIAQKERHIERTKKQSEKSSEKTDKKKETA